MWKLLRQYFMPIYISDIDLFLQNYDQHHPQLSQAQRKEYNYYQNIYYLRDNNHGAT